MKVKKNPKKDLSKNSSIYFAFGLMLVLAVTYVALEWKTSNKKHTTITEKYDKDLFEETPPLLNIKIPPPPPAPVAPSTIEIVSDEKEVPENLIKPTEPTEKKVYEVDSIPVIDEPDVIEVPFALIENAPIFPGCEKASDKRTCFNRMMQKHIRKNFRYPKIAQEMGIQGRVIVLFVIAKDGNITGIKMRGPDKNLEKEAARIISKLPKMIPGKQRGNAVQVPFSIPITFKLY